MGGSRLPPLWRCLLSRQKRVLHRLLTAPLRSVLKYYRYGDSEPSPTPLAIDFLQDLPTPELARFEDFNPKFVA